MKFQFFKISVCGDEECVKELNTFCAAHKIVTVDKNFIEMKENSFWSFCITYLEGKAESSAKQAKVDYREVLNEKDFTLFVELRNLRKKLAEKEGVPAYALFTNEQLSLMVTRRVTSFTAMEKIHGIGKGRTEKYGSSFLEILCREFKSEKSPD